ncbi:hypothetical protein [Streptomyces guryensis]|uniref:Uncharacterized protein n=1 Tax=Streptomyces guryensis TaxID=2886947 RepID=A0A9Q3Z5F6_9ACTN|nr:hypothetical protein [Streptomyces guryensis]MCD9874079.1 hypothetical protein [Streptomyces guryensis]
MPEHPWFVIEPEDDEELELTDDDRAFAAALRERTAGWAEARVDGWLDRTDDALVACLSFGDPGARRHLIDVGVHFYGGRVRGDRLHNQLFILTDRPSTWALEATGTVDELADRSARWFRSVLDKPVVLYVWLNDDRYAYAARFAYADDNRTISQMYSKDLAPAGQAEELIAAGHVHGKGWIQTVGLPTPTLHQHVRGDRSRAVVPAGARAVTERGPLHGVWYE